ncbi:MAG: anion permease [Candidatus Bipolaricaulota bacterium]|nr:anion permease [Candidatus Bipolaricaulota bacterium]MDW8127142.1 anion permease [Candidatus Bipolaricaulota bacterium]
MWAVLPALFMGWALGANDAANVCGLAVAVGAIRYRTAVLLTAVCAVLGAALSGAAGMSTYGALAAHGLAGAFVVALAAGLTVTLMTWRGLPVSTSQAAVGAIVGVALASGKSVDWSVLGRIVLSWITSPLGALLLAFFLHRFLTPMLGPTVLGLERFDLLVRWGLVLIGIWGAYALGANNVANVTGVFVGAGVLSPSLAGLVGGASIALGVLTYSRPVMDTIGQKLVQVGTWPALLALASQAAVLQVFTFLGVPVSSSQAIVGAVVGVGLVKGVSAVNLRQVLAIMLGWVSTPALSGCIGALGWLSLRVFF